MWVATKTGYISCVQHNSDPDIILARARRREHLADSFPNYAHLIEDDKKADYQFRLNIPRLALTTFMVDSVAGIDYHSHVKEELSKGDPQLYTAYLAVWTALSKIQPNPPYGGWTGGKTASKEEQDRYSQAEIDRWWATTTHKAKAPKVGTLFADEIDRLEDFLLDEQIDSYDAVNRLPLPPNVTPRPARGKRARKKTRNQNRKGAAA